MTSDKQCRVFIVSGRVQGVFFRASTRDQAARLGLDGQVRNCADGSVEVIASGPTAALDELALWLAHGPPLAQVDKVETTRHRQRPLAGFVIARD